MSIPIREAQLRKQFEDNRIQFLLTELDTGATFCEVARSSNDPEKTKRNVGNGRKAYDTILRFREGAPFDTQSKTEFDQKFSHLKSLLKDLGEDF